MMRACRDLIIGGIAFVLVLNLFLFPSFHGGGTHDVDSSFESFKSSTGAVDTVGLDWAPVTDRDALRCSNLELLTKWKRETLPLKPSEKRLWEELGCEVKLDESHMSRLGALVKQSRAGSECVSMLQRFRIVPGKNWGTADTEAQRRWDRQRCNCYFERACFAQTFPRRAPSIHVSTSPSGITTAVGARRSHERLAKGSQGAPVVAIVLGATSKKVRFETMESNPLFVHLLPSIERTLEPGYEYWVVIGYDTGDLFYDDEKRLESLRKWFRRNVVSPLEEDGIVAKIVFIRFTNVLMKPGPVFNIVSASAFADGADYVFRVNDDTEIMTIGWAGEMIARLGSMTPPNVGVVGPTGSGDASFTRQIITHDFVHKTHMRIFKSYYPSVLSDWWMDDWISHVYPEGNAFKLNSVMVQHHTEVVAKVHGTDPGDPVRYEVDFGHKSHLQREVARGGMQIESFIHEHCSNGFCTEDVNEESVLKGDSKVGNLKLRRGTDDGKEGGDDAITSEEAALFGSTDVNRTVRTLQREKEMNEQEDEEFKRWEDENDQGDDDWKNEGGDEESGESEQVDAKK